MIEIVEGVGVGSGKSAYVCARIAHILAGGGTCVATDKFEIVWDRLVGPLTQEETASRRKHLGGYRFPVEGMYEYIMHEHGVKAHRDQFLTISSDATERLHEHTPQGTDDCPVTLILDEAQDKLNARDVMEGDSRRRKKELFSWLCQSRHDNNDLIFITQNHLNVDAQVRRLCSNIIRVRNMVTFAIGGMKTTWWKKFCVNVNDQTGKNMLRREWLAHDPGLFLSYVSKSQKGSHQRAGVIHRRKLERVESEVTPVMKFLLALMLVAILALGSLVFKMSRGNIFTQAGTTVSAAAAPTLAHSSPLTAPGATPKPAVSIVREIFRGGDMRSYLHTDAGEYEVGTLCQYGMVKVVQGTQACIECPDKTTIYVITRYARMLGGAENLEAQANARPATYYPDHDDEWKRNEAIARRVSGLSPEVSESHVPQATPAPETPRPRGISIPMLPSTRITGR